MSANAMPGWSVARLGDVAEIIRGVTFPASAKADPGAAGTTACLRTSNVQATLEYDDLMFIPDSFVKREDQWVRPGDVVMSMANSANLVGKVACALEPLPARLTFGAFLSVLRPKVVDAGYLFQFLRAPATQEMLRSSASQTVNIANLSVGRIVDLEVPVAPLNEQRRIVAKLEALQARSRRAREALEAVPPLLEKLRQSILAAAFRGDLTKEWRAKNPNVEPASELLKRIRIERRKKWEESELAKMKAKGKAPKDDKWKEKYKEPEPVNAEGLPELPEGWCWASLDALTFIVGGITKGQKRRGDELLRAVTYLRVANVQRGHLDLAEVKTIDATETEITDLRLVAGDILLNEGGDRDKLGRGWVWENQLEECIHQNHVFRARPVMGDLVPRYISLYANHHGQAFFLEQGKQTTNLASVSMSRVRKFPIALPPCTEQVEVCRRTEARLSAILALDSTQASIQHRLDTLESSVLAAAFRGKLLPQAFSASAATRKEIGEKASGAVQHHLDGTT